MKRYHTREQRLTIIYSVLCLVLMVIVIQLWLLTATMDAYMGGDDKVIWPAALVSLACFVLVACLLRYLSRLEPGP
jgi:hypothetical protein